MLNYEDYETNNLEKIDAKISPFSEMTREEREFLNGLLRYHKPKKILEVGVSAGASSAIMLNACCDWEAEIHSIDYVDKWYNDASKDTGFLINKMMPDLAAKWHLHTGAIAAKFMDDIGGDIDFCLLDTTHVNPGEFLDFLMVFPYLKPDAIIVIHDVSLHTVNYKLPFGDVLTTCGTLFSALRGTRFLPSKTNHKFFPNIGAIKLSADLKDDLWPFFNLLTLPWRGVEKSNWSYLEADEWSYMEKFIARHYPAELQIFFSKIIEYKNCRAYDAVNEEKHPVNETQKCFVKVVINFVKSYLLFPWYVYKTYKKMERVERLLR